ncbi:unnamed protein product [Rotaria sp. Silwood1]|nr:unnamed protein product [Rotaria sp. Silwood1]
MDDTKFSYETIVSLSGDENIHLFSCIKVLDSMTTSSIGFDQIASAHIQLMKQIQEHLSLEIHLADVTKINSEINEILTTDVFPLVSIRYRETTEEMRAMVKEQEQLMLNIYLKKNLEEDENIDQSIPVESLHNTFSEGIDTFAIKNKIEQNKLQIQQVSYFALRSLTSLLLMFIKSAEKNDPTFVQELLTLTIHLCDQIPMINFTASDSSPLIGKHWFQSLQPLTNYFHELSLSKNLIVANKSMKILLNFAIAKASFKDILTILRKLLFNKVHVYNVQRLFTRMNNCLIETLNTMPKKKQQQQNNNSDHNFEQDIDDDTVANETTDYLKAIGVFPNSQLVQLNEKEFTGPFVASVVLAHIDFYNRIHSVEHLKYGSIDSSISFEFHPTTFEQLFHIIEQFIATKIKGSNMIICHILTVCLRLFATHLKFLSIVSSTLDRDLLSTNEKYRKTSRISSSKSKFDIDLTIFANDHQYQLWFDLLLKLICNEDEILRQGQIRQEASKALMYIIDKRARSFTEKLSFFYAYIIENKYSLFVEQLFIELKKSILLLSWIEVLVNDDENNSEKMTALAILYSFVDICSNPSNDIDLPRKKQIRQILIMFQELLLTQLISPSQIENTQYDDSTQSDLSKFLISHGFVSFITTYVSHILRSCADNDLLNSIFISLCLMTKTENIFNFDQVQPIFTKLLPILVQYLLKNTMNQENLSNSLYIICWLIGKMSNVMIIGPEQNFFELKHIDKLKSLLFAGGCEKIIIEKNKYLFDLYESNLAVYSRFKIDNQMQESLSSLSDDEFLMSIYNNIGQGAQLISKMKEHVEDRQQLLKSIEHEANDACAALFAVYIKHYRRIDLAKRELLRRDDEKPHNKLLSIYECSNDVKILFTTTRAQGGNLNELYKQIKMNTLFLLLYIREGNLIPIIETDEDLSALLNLTNIQPKKRLSFQRQVSRWTKAKYVLRLLRNTMQACVRFKKLMLAKKQTKLNLRIESNLNQLIDTFVYGDFYKTTTLITSEEKKLELDELSQCMSRCYERAMTRLITYHFSHKFIQNLLEIDDQNQIVTILNLYLPHLRSSHSEWFYLENIQATNNQLKEQIRDAYYSIIKTIFSFILRLLTFEPKLLIQNMFHLLNLSYKSIDIVCLNQDQFVEVLFLSFVSFTKESNYIVSLDTKLTAYNWFRFYVCKLCENIGLDENMSISNEIVKQQQFAFNIIILNELKRLKQLQQLLPTDVENEVYSSIENRKYSLNHAAIDWFIKAATVENDISIHSSKLSSKRDVELCTNQLLVFLLRCIYLYDNVRLICANIDYIEELLYIYRSSKNQITVLLALKILRNLIPLFPETTNEIAIITIKNLLDELLVSIGNSFMKQNMTSEIITELINIYRTVIFLKSPWQMMATQLIYNAIISFVNEIKLKSFNTIDTIQMNYVFASLCVFGGYIQPYCLGSIVNVYPNEESNEYDLAIIIDINTDDENSNSSEVLPYFIQYLKTNKTEWISGEKLRIEIDVMLPNLFLLININDSNLTIHSLFDALGYIIQMDTSTTESLILLELKRHCMSALCYMLNDKKLVEIFMEKPYSSFIAKLSMSDSLFKNYSLPVDLRLFNQQHLEQYCLSLNTDLRFKQIIETGNDNYTTSNNNNNQISQQTTIIEKEDNTSFIIWDQDEFNRDPLVVNALSMSALKYNGWKPYTSKSEIELFERGRIGDKNLVISSMPRNFIDSSLIKECGDKHRFNGEICLTTESETGIFPTFIVDNLQLTEGKWYYCVRLPIGGIVQIGYATTGFTPLPREGIGVGDDKYSWSYDGSRGTLYNDGEFIAPFEEICWIKNDICGCGIEIKGENIRIKYWLNGKFLGTPFEHQGHVGTSTAKCNMLPHGHKTTYFPAVTVHVPYLNVGWFEFIFSPDDMARCPLPDGYKPLLLPTLINIENSIVPYPNSAYLIGFDTQHFFHRKRSITPKTLLCDFVNEYHLDTSCTLDDYQLLLLEDSGGFPLSINSYQSSLTISFDFEILNKISNHSNELFNFLLFTLDATEICSVRIPSDQIDNRARTAIVICSKEQKIKIYLNNLYQVITSSFEIQTMTKFNFHILPNIGARIKNIGVWKYALCEEHIRRLFTYGLSYVAVDYRQLTVYQQQANSFVFNKNQKHFNNELLVPFNESFEESLWKKKKEQIDIDETKYFRTIDDTDESTIQLYGNKTYLVLSKSIEQWFEYSLILDISLPNLPTTNEHITILSINSEAAIYITHKGKICLLNHEKINKSKRILKLNEYMRLAIFVQKKSVEIYINGILHIRSNVDKDQFVLKTNHIDLFREADLEMNTTNDDLIRIKCKSITFLNRLVELDLINQQMKSPNDSLVSLVAPPFSLIASNLIAIGYKEEWIKWAIQKTNSTNSQVLDTVIRENTDEFLKIEHENQQKRNLIILFRVNPSFIQEKWHELGNIPEFNNEGIITIGQLICDYKNCSNDSIHMENNNNNESDKNGQVRFEKEWYQQMVYGLQIPNTIFEWMNDKSSRTDLSDIYQLLDLRKSEQQFTTEILDQRKIIHKSIQYSHKQISRKQYLDSRFACEHGLITIYARNSILNMLKVWSNEDSSSFSLEKFGDYAFMVKLLRLLDYHYTYRSSYIDDNMNRVTFLIHSILQFETKEFIKQANKNKEFTIEMLKSKAPLFLIQASQTFNLNVRSQNFFFHLLNELLLITVSMSSPVTRTLQTIVMDLVFLLIKRQSSQDTMTTERQNEKFEFELAECSQNFHDLVIVINIIEALIDKSKHTQYPKQFIEQTYDILSENPKYTSDDFQKSNTLFDTLADLQLIKLMNEHPSMNNSFNQFISNLPTESTQNSTFYKNYPALINIPAKFIQVRAKFFYQFNIFVEKTVSMLDFSLLPNQSILVDYIRIAKIYLLEKRKLQWLKQSLTQTEIHAIIEPPEVTFDTIEASINGNEGESTMFSQAFQQLHENAHILFRHSNERLWRAQYLEMHSTDQGGPYRDSITAICSDICSTRLPLFILCPNGQMNNGLNRDCWIPNVFPPHEPISNKFKKQYQFIGQLMGMAFRKKHYLNLKFANLLWKQLVGEPITMKDIEAIDIQCGVITKEMEINIEQNKSINIDSDMNYLFSSVLSELCFDVISSSGQTYELIPGGQDIPVTTKNLTEYCTHYREYRLNEFHRQIEYIRQGLCSVIPSDFLTLFTADELEVAICGKGHIDVLLLKRNTIYNGRYNENSPHIQRFWIVLNDMFDEEQKKLFLIFVWGRSTLPRDDREFTSKFIIQTIFPDANYETDQMLPRAHTCFFILDLPEYSTTEIMYERLNYAITNCSSIDADGMIDDVLNPANQIDNTDLIEQLPIVLTTLLDQNHLLI